jgi:hypothetical protein
MIRLIGRFDHITAKNKNIRIVYILLREQNFIYIVKISNLKLPFERLISFDLGLLWFIETNESVALFKPFDLTDVVVLALAL